MRYPLLTRIGRYEPRVASGTRVLAGEVLAAGNARTAGLLHAAASGVVEVTQAEVLLHPDGLEDALPPLAAEDLARRVCDAGIVGLGGAGYPTWLKLRQAKRAAVTTLVVNAVECEPDVSADRSLLRDHEDEILAGLRALADYLGASRTILALGEGRDVDIPDTEVARVTGPYPSGSERTLVRRLLGMELQDGNPTDLGIVVFNAATVFAVHRAWHCGERLVERVVTVQDENCWLRIGHPVRELALPAGEVTVGGPVTGWLARQGESIAKTTRAVTVKTPVESSPCIRCGWCADSCPEGLLPQELFRHINAGHWTGMDALRLDHCVECGACDMACPSRLPLLATFRYGKSERRERERRGRDAAVARDRFTARSARLERQRADERREREARMASRREWTRPG
ncbi:MAG: 4Fe-4S dicluster domain-containing protein [Gammaproteobacteria bacterium]|nr:4Fe-4S dicluster domain-containing protein [Gammaproteobacteria bacterium]